MAAFSSKHISIKIMKTWNIIILDYIVKTSTVPVQVTPIAGLEIDNEKIKNNSIFDASKKVANSYIR